MKPSYKKIAILGILAFCFITVVPAVIRLIEASMEGWHSSLLSSMLDGLE